MNLPRTLLFPGALLLASVATAAPNPPYEPEPSPSAAAKRPAPAAEQLTTEGSVFSPEQARAIIEQFRATNEKLGKLRYLIVVTHEQMSSSPPTVADRNRTRDVEQWTRELFASAGANLIDPSVGVPLLGSKPYHRLPAADNAKAKKDRAALSGAADAVVEVTIVVRYVKVPTSAGETTYVVPGVMIEAYRISDSALLGATSTLDVLKSRGLPDDAIMKITMHDRAETAALALMEDMKRNVP